MTASAVTVIAPTAHAQTLTQTRQPQIQRPLAIALIRDTLTALNHANWTGNYSVFRDYASPNFARANDPVRLTAIFQPIRAERLDLLPALVLEPVITRGEFVQGKNQFRLTGYFPSQPKHIQFDLLYEPVDNRWKLFGIAVSPSDPIPVRQQQTPAAPQQASKPEAQLQPVAPAANPPQAKKPVAAKPKTQNPAKERRPVPVPKTRP